MRRRHTVVVVQCRDRLGGVCGGIQVSCVYPFQLNSQDLNVSWSKVKLWSVLLFLSVGLGYYRLHTCPIFHIQVISD